MYGIGFILKRDKAQYGSENFFTRDSHVIIDIGKNGGFYKIACFKSFGFPGASGQQACTLFNAGLDQPLNAIKMTRTYQWANVFSR